MRSRSSVGKSIRTQLLTTPDRMQRRGSQACLIIADLTTLDRFLSTTDFLIFAETDKACMAKMIVGGPFEKPKLGYGLRA